MILRRLSPGSPCGSELVGTLQPENVIRTQVPLVSVPDPEFYSSTKYRDSKM